MLLDFGWQTAVTSILTLVLQTSYIEGPDPRVTHHDVYHEFDCNQTAKEQTQPSFVEKSLFDENTS